MGSDGEGVTTLVGGFGCPLACKYCLNPQSTRISTKPSAYSVESLYEAVLVDSLYFEATGGGITFGGGEPLLQADFIAEFIRFVKAKGHGWRFSMETCLAVSEDRLRAVIDLVDLFIVDIKDQNDEIYLRYTGRDSSLMKHNLRILADECPSRVRVKIPFIPGYNLPSDLVFSQTVIENMGFSQIERLKYHTDIRK